ncbi:MAG: hypothetical protein GXP31_08320 [Kiritimatiellaeota bacterium]|nr:hypothetical protein [Kiritimatiellota bacterium]
MFGNPRHDSARVVKQALAFRPPERIPVFDGFWAEFLADWRQVRRPPPEMDIEDYYWIDLKVPVACEQLFPTRMREVRRDGPWVFCDDGWGRVVRSRPGSYFTETVERVLNAPGDLDAIEFDPPGLDLRYTSFAAEVARHRSKGRAVFVKIGGPFIRSAFFRGETEFLMDLAADEAFARAVVERVAAHLLAVGLESLRRADAYDCGVWIFDDMCNAIGPMFSPATFERVFLPVYRRMVAAFKAAGARWVVLHCDGNLAPLLDMVIEAGIDGINPVEFAAGLDVVRLLERYAGRLFFIGGVCNTHVLPSGDPAAIRRHVERIVAAGRDGGLVIGSHSIGPDISIGSYELYRRIVAAACTTGT